MRAVSVDNGDGPEELWYLDFEVEDALWRNGSKYCVIQQADKDQFFRTCVNNWKGRYGWESPKPSNLPYRKQRSNSE